MHDSVQYYTYSVVIFENKSVYSLNNHEGQWGIPKVSKNAFG
jgi:hypothetical protein